MHTDRPTRLRFFLPDARLLKAEEVEHLMDQQPPGDATGLWLEINCPDGSCIDEEGRITLPARKVYGDDLFSHIFCPEDACEVVQSTDLP